MSARHNPWAACRIQIMAPQKPKPKAGDRRITKKHGEQVRVHVVHNGMPVMTGGHKHYSFEWVSVDNPRAQDYAKAQGGAP